MSQRNIFSNYQDFGWAFRNERPFLTVQQAADLLDITNFEARYRIQMYRLDAFLIAGQYRIPLTAIDDYREATEAIELQWSALMSYEQVLDNTIKVNPNKTLVKRHYNNMDGQEKAPRDWYDLARLELPIEASGFDWAALMGVDPADLAVESGWDLTRLIEWPEIYDFLIDREVMNLPLPCNPKQKEEPDKAIDDGQLELF